MSTQLSTTEILERIDRLIELLERSIVRREHYPPKLTKYELARVVAARALQLSMGAQPQIDVGELNTTDPVLIAMEEIKRGKVNFVVVRELPDGKTVKLSLKELLSLEREI